MQTAAMEAASIDLIPLVCEGALAMVRLSALMVFAPVFSSPAIAPRIKAGFVLAMALLIAPVLVRNEGAVRSITLSAVLSELGVGFVLGLALMVLSEAVVFASALLGMQFSFSLVNLLDPISKVETPLLGQLLNWTLTLVLLAAGLHRTVLAALLRSFELVPTGTFVPQAKTGAALAHMAGSIFLVGVQLAAPVIAAALTVEVTVGLVARLSPQLPATIMSVPLKTMVSYAVLMGSLAIWPGCLERNFVALLDRACGLLMPAGGVLR